VIDAAKEWDAQKDNTINQLKVKNTRLNAAVATKHVCAGCSIQAGKNNLFPTHCTTV